MKIRVKAVAALLLVAALIAPVSACSGSSSGGKGTVTWSTWGSPDELKAFEQFNADFTERHPDIKVIFQPVASYDQYHSKLNTQLTSGTAPDVFYVGDDHIAAVAGNKVLLPLDDKLNAAGSVIKLDEFDAGIYRVAEVDGKLYGLPNDVNPDALWYDKEALKAAGISDDPAELAANNQWTTAKFFEMTEKLQAAGMTGAAFWNYWSTHDSWMTSQGGVVYDADGNYVANTDAKAVKAMEEMAEHMGAGDFVVADTMPSGDDADVQLVTHKLGFLVQGRYTIATIEGAGLSVDDYDVVRWPTPSGAPASTGVAASFLAINAKAADADAAYTFFSEFLSAQGQKTRLGESGNAVPSINGLDSLVTDGGKPAHAASLIQMRDLGYSNFPTEAAVPGLSNDISNDLMLPLYQGKANAKETLDKVAALVAEKTGK